MGLVRKWLHCNQKAGKQGNPANKMVLSMKKITILIFPVFFKVGLLKMNMTTELMVPTL